MGGNRDRDTGSRDNGGSFGRSDSRDGFGQRVLVAALVDKMGETAKNRVAKGSPTVAVMVAAVSLVVLRVANGLVTAARGCAKGAEKVHQMPAVGVRTVHLTGATKVYPKAHWILEARVMRCCHRSQRAVPADLVGQVTEVVVA